MSPTLNEVLQRVRRLPPLRAIVLEVLRSMEHPHANMAKLAAGISRDAVLSASTLRIVNSSFYGLPHKVESVQQAVMILGNSNLRGIIVAAALVTDYALPQDGPLEVRRFWLHNFSCAVWARMLSREAPLLADLAFTAGLLHDLGKLVLALNYAELYAGIDRRAQAEGLALDVVERETLGFDHAAIGAELLAHWRLSERLVRAVAAHHSPPQPDEDALCALARNANQIAHQAEADDAGTLDRLRPLVRLDDDAVNLLIETARRECEVMRTLIRADGDAK
jgi:putative nucleotidyltransferase with HDIG domain